LPAEVPQAAWPLLSRSGLGFETTSDGVRIPYRPLTGDTHRSYSRSWKERSTLTAPNVPGIGFGGPPVAADVGIRTRLDDERQDPDQYQHEEQYGKRGGKLEPALGFAGTVVGVFRIGLRVSRHDARPGSEDRET